MVNRKASTKKQGREASKEYRHCQGRSLATVCEAWRIWRISTVILSVLSLGAKIALHDGFCPDVKGHSQSITQVPSLASTDLFASLWAPWPTVPGLPGHRHKSVAKMPQKTWVFLQRLQDRPGYSITEKRGRNNLYLSSSHLILQVLVFNMAITVTLQTIYHNKCSMFVTKGAPLQACFVAIKIPSSSPALMKPTAVLRQPLNGLQLEVTFSIACKTFQM